MSYTILLAISCAFPMKFIEVVQTISDAITKAKSHIDLYTKIRLICLFWNCLCFIHLEILFGGNI